MIENITTVDRSMFHEILKPLHKGKVKKFGILLIALLIIGILLLVIRLTAGIEFLVLTALCAAGLYSYYNSLIKKQENAMVQNIQETYGTDRYDVRYFVIDGIIFNRSSKESPSYPISDIQQAIETENYVVVILPEQVLVSLDKRGFMKGSAEEFTALLHEANVPFN